MKLMEVTCRCGYTTRGSEGEVIRTIQTHARADHALEVTPAEIRAVWQIVDDELADGQLDRGSR